MKYYEINGSLNRFGDICQTFNSLADAEKAYADMVRDGVKHLELKEIDNNPNYYYSKSIRIG